MKRVGLRRRFPRLSYAIRWYLVGLLLADRAYRRATPEQRVQMLMVMELHRMGMGL